MGREEIEESVINMLLVQGACSNGMSREASFKDDLVLDSLDVVQVLLEIENEFDVDIEDDLVKDLETVDGLVNVVTSAVAKELGMYSPQDAV